MKKFFPLLLLLALLTSCSMAFLRDEMKINDLIQYKEKIDNTENPAEVYIIKADLASKVISLEGLLVKDIIESTNVDYQFCVVSELQTEKGKIECYIFTKNIRRISYLEKGKTIIDVRGEFKRFFSTLDNYYTKIEIINSSITIVTPAEK